MTRLARLPDSLDCPPAPQLRPAVTPEARQQLQAFIAARYAQMYSARVSAFLPQLFALQDAAGELLAAFGLRPARSQTLFLENYLDVPIEQALALASGRPVSRSEVVEVGNLAGRHAGALRLLIPLLGDLLQQAGYRWVVFTGNARLINGFERLGIPLAPLAAARPERLPEDARADWGCYYDFAPTVMAGDIPAGRRLLQTRGEPSA